jgi:hypothetical protein
MTAFIADFMGISALITAGPSRKRSRRLLGLHTLAHLSGDYLREMYMRIMVHSGDLGPMF